MHSECHSFPKKPIKASLVLVRWLWKFTFSTKVSLIELNSMNIIDYLLFSRKHAGILKTQRNIMRATVCLDCAKEKK